MSRPNRHNKPTPKGIPAPMDIRKEPKPIDTAAVEAAVKESTPDMELMLGMVLEPGGKMEILSVPHEEVGGVMGHYLETGEIVRYMHPSRRMKEVIIPHAMTVLGHLKTVVYEDLVSSGEQAKIIPSEGAADGGEEA